jgi:hypothetical protein
MGKKCPDCGLLTQLDENGKCFFCGNVPPPPKPAEKPHKEKSQPIFSGAHSKSMWDAINSVKTISVRKALYIMGCRLQELESLLKK